MSAQPIQSKGLQPVEINGELFYRIADTGAIMPFREHRERLSTHWLFFQQWWYQRGQKETRASPFPYYTDDKIASNGQKQTGSKTIFRIRQNGGAAYLGTVFGTERKPLPFAA